MLLRNGADADDGAADVSPSDRDARALNCCTPTRTLFLGNLLRCGDVSPPVTGCSDAGSTTTCQACSHPRSSRSSLTCDQAETTHCFCPAALRDDEATCRGSMVQSACTAGSEGGVRYAGGAVGVADIPSAMRRKQARGGEDDGGGSDESAFVGIAAGGGGAKLRTCRDTTWRSRGDELAREVPASAAPAEAVSSSSAITGENGRTVDFELIHECCANWRDHVSAPLPKCWVACDGMVCADGERGARGGARGNECPYGYVLKPSGQYELSQTISLSSLHDVYSLSGVQYHDDLQSILSHLYDSFFLLIFTCPIQ